MQINSIQHIQSPNFRAVNHKGIKVITQNELSITDCFNKSRNIFNLDDEIIKFDKKIKKSCRTLSNKDIFLISKNIAKKFDLKEKEALEFLNLITQFSSYKSIKSIEKELVKNNIHSIVDFKQLSSLKDEKIQPNLNMVFKYILNKNSSLNLQDTDKEGLIIDSELLNNLYKLDSEKLNNFKEEIKNAKIELLYIPNFENSYNIFNQTSTIEDFTNNTIKKSQGNFHKSIASYISENLNKENLKGIKDLNLDIKIISPKINKNFTTDSIAEQVNPITPTIEDYYNYLNTTPIEIANKTDFQKYILEFLNRMNVVISPRDYSMGLQNLHKQIQDFISREHKDPQKVYYAIPDTNKSFIMALYQYKKANNINDFNIIYPKTSIWLTNHFNINNLPKNSTIVVLDDCAISGASLIYEQFDYLHIPNEQRQNKELSVILAPLLITQKGKNNIDSCLSSKDKLITTKVLPTWDVLTKDKDCKYLNLEQDNQYLTSLILPYMGPDTNCAGLIDLYEKFFLDTKAQKNPISNLDFQLPIF